MQGVGKRRAVNPKITVPRRLSAVKLAGDPNNPARIPDNATIEELRAEVMKHLERLAPVLDLEALMAPADGIASRDMPRVERSMTLGRHTRYQHDLHSPTLPHHMGRCQTMPPLFLPRVPDCAGANQCQAAQFWAAARRGNLEPSGCGLAWPQQAHRRARPREERER